MSCHFCPSGAQSEEERPGVPRVHPQVHGGVEQRPVCESQPPGQPRWETPAANIQPSPPPHTIGYSRRREKLSWYRCLRVSKTLSFADYVKYFKCSVFSSIWNLGGNSVSCAQTPFFQKGSQLFQQFFSSLSFPHWFEAPLIWFMIYQILLCA